MILVTIQHFKHESPLLFMYRCYSFSYFRLMISGLAVPGIVLHRHPISTYHVQALESYGKLWIAPSVMLSMPLRGSFRKIIIALPLSSGSTSCSVSPFWKTSVGDMVSCCMNEKASTIVVGVRVHTAGLLLKILPNPVVSNL